MPRTRNYPRITNNVRKTIEVDTKAAPVLFQVAFHPDEPELSPPVPTNGAGGTAPPDGIGAALTTHVLTNTTAPQIAIPMAIGIRKNNSNHENQWKVLPLHQDLLSTLTVMSRRRPVLERATATQIMLSRAKTHL